MMDGKRTVLNEVAHDSRNYNHGSICAALQTTETWKILPSAENLIFYYRNCLIFHFNQN